ncbi:MAG TPA: hypothetical protein VEA63_06195, partial [Opitutus sp.]|nr:hypothetical protein [Opitutus sp.]
NLLTAYHFLKEIETARQAGDPALVAQKESDYHALLREDVEVRTRFIALLSRFSTLTPVLTRTSLSEQGIARQVDYMKAEIEKTNAYLAQHAGTP